MPLKNGLSAGRHEQNDLVLGDHQVSRQHTRFALGAEGWYFEDLGSRHGTLINGARAERSALRHGDCVQIGNVLLTFSDASEPPTIVHQQVTAVPPPAPDGPDRRLQLLYDVSRAVGDLTNEGDLLGRMLEATLDVFACERALVGLCVEGKSALRRTVRAREPSAGDDVVISRAILDAVIDRREGVILRSGRGRDTPGTLLREKILSAMAVPLRAGDRVVGLLYVDDRQRDDRFAPRDLEFFTALGHLTAAALESAERFRRVAAVAEALRTNGLTDELLGESEPMRRLKAQIHKYGAASANVLIRGESGTGKELVARTLHAVSGRAEQPFVTLNCAAIPETMIESELFGYVKGAFTGALRDKRGKFALADRGTLFLDEIGDLDLAAQAKVLRAIQEGEIQPLGSERTSRVNVRIFAATHKDLQAEIAAKRFREDLYYRLSVVEIEAPPLRERGDDIELLARALLKSSASSMAKRPMGFTPAALAALRRYPWPGNVRELRNEMERAAINAELSTVDLGDLSPKLRSSAGVEPPVSGRRASLAEQYGQLEPTERRLVEEAMREARGNLSEAARLLGISWIMMKRRVERFGLGGASE
ncbi:MAG TPA: sigma 54-interacting transcriptional regulator [Polyangiaceae bacterium]|nr:sigma 54-interacting transcriptional regulator [Polyangiaceae bacterium]